MSNYVGMSVWTIKLESNLKRVELIAKEVDDLGKG